ncbi:hypothetical protein CDAR_471381 [Caerostris darwini]|uniref:Uncharacterized protein n=1 Tax=Caerostris darwini TaxID=1538125 RepID=A0AAV4RNC0_9ARAC|nr:hypothetical protein CDAR_471381 [Caerostris darwini]
MIAFPTTEQYQLKDEILKPTINLKYNQIHNSLSTSVEISIKTIKMRKPAVDQLLCYPTVEQYHLKDNIINPIINHKICSPKPSNSTPKFLIQFGKPQ